MNAGIDGARRLAADGDVVLVAAEACDIARDPFQHGLLVENAVIAEQVAFIIERRMRQEAHEVEAVAMVTTTVLPCAASLLPS